MLVYPEEYQDFAGQVKRVILLEVLESVLRLDGRQLEEPRLKLWRLMRRWLGDTLEWVQSELSDTRRFLRQTGGEIIRVRQLEDCREVTAKFRGFIYTQRYMNEWIRSECEEVLYSYWIAGKTSTQESVSGWPH
ncbi:hypothetical protein [Salinithrix halophila]|uniref:hypothetical protein n=1 Tax=Salinithrix halophila TaxID=1485204 RepID=UPI0036D33FB1